MATFKSRWLAWQPTTTPVSSVDDLSPEPNMREKGTDKTDKSPSVSFVSAVSGNIAADDDQVAGAWDATDWRALYDERTDIREFDGELPRREAERLALSDCVVWWLTIHPPLATDDTAGCVHCGADLGDGGVPVLAGAGHTWLHGQCHPSWLAERRRHAAEVLAAMGVGVGGGSKSLQPGGRTSA